MSGSGKRPIKGPAEPDLGRFLDGETDSIEDWRWLWEGDHLFPVASHRGGWLGAVVVRLKRLFRPLVRAPQADLWDRQRAFNLVVLTHLRAAEQIDALGQDLQRIQGELAGDIRGVQGELNDDLKRIHADLKKLDRSLGAFKKQGLADLARQTDALFSILDQKIDRVRNDDRDR